MPKAGEGSVRAGFVSQRTLCGLLLLVGFLQAGASLFGCGPNFPNTLLDGGDAAVLVAPVTDFVGELQRMKLVESRFQAIPAEGKAGSTTFATQTAASEMTDLAAALKKAKVADGEAQSICNAHQAARTKLNGYLAGVETSKGSRTWVYDEKGGHLSPPRLPPPAFPEIETAAGLPGEFADYLQGALAWHNPALVGKGAARAAWEHLLERPPQERRYKSTWAAFMLGKACEEEEPERAVRYFQQVRDLARHGFADSTGLAAASLGLEARVCLRQKKYDRAIELYLEQLAADDPTAGPSLIATSAQALRQGPEVLRALAANPRAQRVITAFIICRHYQRWIDSEGWAREGAARSGPPKNAVKAWLQAVEAADIKDMESAAKLALAAYQNNDMGVAWRWIQRAPNSPVARWLHAKLLLRNGKLAPAAELLATVAHAFPIQPAHTNRTASPQFQDLLSIDVEGCYPDLIPAEQQVLGELGVLRLARREYTQALDALLNAGFWMDAAYVAERVLTVNELKTYVDAYWAPVSPEQLATETEKYGQSEVSPAHLRNEIRYLLARRLVRSLRGTEAREYYPTEWVTQYDALAQFHRAGRDESLSPEQRAQALFQAAQITRTNGLELVGTELQPDWHVHGGNYEAGISVAGRANNRAAKVLPASPGEAQRAVQHHPDPEERFHYRYQAASLAWEAAKLMPDNSEETARMLCMGGSWLKNRDPKAADVFYKALVRRNRNTSIGIEADRIRWFPELDSQGKVIPRPPSHLESAPPPASPDELMAESPPAEPDARAAEYPVPGQPYIVHAGDSLHAIARAASVWQREITVKDILEANPGLDATRLLIGQKLMIPAGSGEKP